MLASGGHINHIGDEIAAFDTGDPKVVYPAGGGMDWILVTAFLVLQITAVTYVPIRLVRKLRRRRALRP